ncbi:AraC family transcriptional regulator [Mycolicibacterium helvum]|uniref:AraC family transcriptional regulator n=1 Tax=Mycolicibacterium helvum TaxID=1534349 RepID=A0A7I7SXZ9_9MYCO|nr:AraC family transcriptional regulator [Mycolicibacterium helvum]BBY61904.1 AraC family transcriptional regulator [Mycolicibacterium helvum]
MTSGPARDNGTRVFVATTAEDAQVVGSDVFHPHDIRVHGDETGFQMKLVAASIGPITLGRLEYSTEVEIRTSELTDAYQVNIPMRGHLLTASGPMNTVATPHRGAVYRCDAQSLLRGWSSPHPSPVLAVKIDRRALEQQLGRHLGVEIDCPIPFGLALDLDSVEGRQWVTVVEAITGQLDRPWIMATNPLVVDPFAELLMGGLLLAAEHAYSDRLRAPARLLPRSVRAAVDYIEAHAAEPLTVAGVAHSVGVSVRTLQVSFREVLGTSPMRYVRTVRLRGARRQLLASDHHDMSVTDIAHSWGFLHVGRFAGDYRTEFGVSPSDDLRSQSRP